MTPLSAAESRDCRTAQSSRAESGGWSEVCLYEEEASAQTRLLSDEWEQSAEFTGDKQTVASIWHRTSVGVVHQHTPGSEHSIKNCRKIIVRTNIHKLLFLHRYADLQNTVNNCVIIPFVCLCHHIHLYLFLMTLLRNTSVSSQIRKNAVSQTVHRR